MTELTRTETAETDGETSASRTWKRRGLFAAAWAAVAGIVLRETEQPVSASTAMLIANTETAGVSNPVVGPSTVAATSAYFGVAASVMAPLIGDGTLGEALAGVQGTSLGAPVEASQLCGVYGQGNTGTGVLGTSSGGSPFSAVHGIGTGGATGVQGDSTSGMGVLGTIPAASTANGIALYGLNNSSYAGPGPGAGGFGVYGLSAKGHGLVGATSAAGAGAVVGATNGVSGAYAGVFYGPVLVGGAFTVVGGPKSAAVPHPDGSHRLLYCVESPESWFEDFGEGRLECGTAEVTFDPDFAAVVNMEKYHVFLTEYDDHNAVFVTERTPSGFRVQAKTGTGEGAFSWRVVAKRKDIAGERLATITVPPEPVLPPPISEEPASRGIHKQAVMARQS
jgi:hypothetical protein